MFNMDSLEKIVHKMLHSPKSVKFSELEKICLHYFGTPRQNGTSHQIYKTPWRGDPRINIQNYQGQAKPYQLRQVIKAIQKIAEMGEENE